MGITRALQRVKRQAKRGGLGALRTGLGKGLRSGSIPKPLRSAARRIAALLDPSNASARASSHKPGSTATPAVERVHTEHLRPVPPEHANKLGSDRGDAPSEEPAAPATGTEVDPVLVGATPVYNATPTEVEPVDATPSDIEPTDATPVTLEVAPAAPEPSKPKNGSQKKRPGPGANQPKEKLAPAGEAAKSAARSGPKGASKRSRGQSGKTSKK